MEASLEEDLNSSPVSEDLLENQMKMSPKKDLYSLLVGKDLLEK